MEKNQVAVCLQVSVQQNQNICICSEQLETLFYFCMIYLRITRKEQKIRSDLCRSPSAVNVMLKLTNDKTLLIYLESQCSFLKFTFHKGNSVVSFSLQLLNCLYQDLILITQFVHKGLQGLKLMLKAKQQKTSIFNLLFFLIIPLRNPSYQLS